MVDDVSETVYRTGLPMTLIDLLVNLEMTYTSKIVASISYLLVGATAKSVAAPIET